MWSIDPPPQWVGRGEELAVVRAGVEALSRGEGALIWVEGEPGIGKSSLVAEALAAGSAPGWDIGWGIAGQLTERLPLRVMLDCLQVRPGSPDPRRAHAADLLRSLRQGLFADGDASVTGIEVLVGLVDELSAAAPTVIVVDDLQWADDASLIVWHQLAASIGQLRLLLIGTCRPAPRRPEVQELRAAVVRHGGAVVTLGPLTETDVTALVTAMLGSPPGDTLRQLTAQAAGNPLYVRELVDAMVREGALEIGPAAEISAAGGRLPASLAAVLTDRLGSVSAGAAQLLRTAALLGGRFAVTDLAVVLRRPASELAADVQEAVAAGILTEHPNDPDLAFRHLLIQQALYESMPAALRTALHAEAARELAAAGADVLSVAQQLSAANKPGEAWARTWLVESGPALAIRAPQVGAEILRRELDATPAGDEARDGLMASLAWALLAAGSYREAASRASRALTLMTDPVRRAETGWVLTRAQVSAGRSDDAIATMRQALASAELPAEWRARMLALLAMLQRAATGDLDAADATAIQALTAGEEAGDAFATAHALTDLWLTRSVRRDHVAALDHIDRALRVLGDDPGHADLRSFAQDGCIFTLQNLDRWPQAEVTLRRAREASQRSGNPDRATWVTAAVLRYWLGEWDDALAELAEHGGCVTLVIDDAHELASTEALAQFARLLTNLPPQAHAIVSTRHDLWLSLHRLRLTGELAEIRAADLRFTEAETRELMEASGVELSETGTALLHQRTEGWAAGLRLAALSLAGHPDPERFVAEFSGTDRTVADYLIAEMLERQPAEVQDLLLRISLLDRVNGELADVLTGRPGSERILLELEDANAFVVSLDPGRTWFRFHQLFGDLVRLELRRTLPEDMPALHRRAAAWFARHGQVVDAIRHTQAAGDWPEAARLLADHAFSLTLDGQARTVEVLVRAFPLGAAADPELALVRAGSDLVQGHLDEAAAHLTVAAAYAETTPPDRRRRLEMAIASLRLWLAQRRAHLAGVVEQAGFLASPVTGRCGEEIAIANDLRAVALMNLGIVEAWSLALTDAERHLREGATLAREIGRPYLEVACLAQLGFASDTGSLATATERCREAIALAERHGWGAEPVIAPALLTLAETTIWTGEFGEGERWLRRAARALDADDAPGIRLRLHLVSGMLHAGRGYPREALEEFRAAGHLRPQLASSLVLGGQVTGWLLATQARLGLTGEARAGLAALADDKAGTGEIRNARAVICLADGDPAGALSAVRDVLDGTAPVIGCGTVVEAQLLAGLAYRAMGDRCAADQSTERALALAEADRLVLPFAMTGSRELLEALPRHQTAHAALLTDILDLLSGGPGGFGGAGSPPKPGGHRGVAPRGPAQLSPGELRVLRYLPTNMSRPQIATELSVSVNTVSTHIRSIYAKLGAEDRSAAVHRARALRLLKAVR